MEGSIARGPQFLGIIKGALTVMKWLLSTFFLRCPHGSIILPLLIMLGSPDAETADVDYIYEARGRDFSIVRRDAGITVGFHKNGYLYGGSLFSLIKSTFIGTNGVICVGGWIGGRLEGLGACRQVNGSVYVGGYKSSKRHGSGIVYSVDGKKILEGKWGKGKFLRKDLTALERELDFFLKVSDRLSSSCFYGDCIEGFGVKIVSGSVLAGLWRYGGLSIVEQNSSGTLFDKNQSKQPICYYMPETCTGGNALGFQIPAGVEEVDCFANPEACGSGVEGEGVMPAGRCARGDCYEGYGVVELDDGSKYWGFFEEGLYHGGGKLVTEKNQFTGKFERGMKHGEGELLVHSTNVKLIGSWRHDGKHGEFKVYKDGKLTSEASYENDKRNGYGNLTYSSGNVYKGNWKDGKRNGFGVESKPDGSRFEGEWKDGYKLAGVEYDKEGSLVRQGNWSKLRLEGGKLVQKVTLEEGCISGNCNNGHGTFVVGKTRYDGSFSNSLKDGNGTYRTKDWTYEGEFKEGVMHGSATFTYKDGSILTAEYRGGSVNGYGVLRAANGDVYKGAWLNGKRHGYGELVKSDSSRYEGNWVVNKKEGFGVLINADGSTYVGEFKSGLYNGIGELVMKTGKKYAGEFRNNLAHGEGAEYFSDGELIKRGYYESGKIVRLE